MWRGDLRVVYLLSYLHVHSGIAWVEGLLWQILIPGVLSRGEAVLRTV